LDGQDVETRGNVLITALRTAGLVAAAPLVTAAAPHVRLDGEQNALHGERRRLSAEVESLYEQQGRVDAGRLQAAVLAGWANLVRFPQSEKAAVHDLRARTAIIAGSNSITLADRATGVGGSSWPTAMPAWRASPR